MVRLTKAQRKDRDRIDAWLEQQPFKENARDKEPKVPNLGISDLIVNQLYVPTSITDGGKFYTPVTMGDELWNRGFQHGLQMNAGTTILEPCAGIGNLIYPVMAAIRDLQITVRLFELDKEALQIGEKLFPLPYVWTSGTPFDHIKEIEASYDIVVMNPPINTKWGTMVFDSEDNWSESGAVKSEHLFLEAAIRACKPGGHVLAIAPYSFIDKLPKGLGVKDWFAQNASALDLGQLPGEFKFSGVRVHGWLIERAIKKVTSRKRNPDAEVVAAQAPKLIDLEDDEADALTIHLIDEVPLNDQGDAVIVAHDLTKDASNFQIGDPIEGTPAEIIERIETNGELMVERIGNLKESLTTPKDKPEEKGHVTEADVTGFDSAELMPDEPETQIVRRDGSSADDLDTDNKTSADIAPVGRLDDAPFTELDDQGIYEEGIGERSEADTYDYDKSFMEAPEPEGPLDDPVMEAEAQLGFDLLPEEPPEPVEDNLWHLDTLLEKIGHVTFGAPPTFAFKRSIQVWGVRDPIILTVDKEKRYRLRDGRRRIQAAKELEIQMVPVRVYDIDTISGVALTLDSNVQRSSNPLSEYEAIVEFITEAKERDIIVSEQDIHYATGMSVQTIRNRMQLASVPNKILEGVTEKKVALGTALAIAKLTPADKNKMLDKLKEKGKLVGEDVAELKRASQSEGFQQLADQIFSQPTPEIGHNHDFQWQANHLKCTCGRVLDPDQIVRTINTFID